MKILPQKQQLTKMSGWEKVKPVNLWLLGVCVVLPSYTLASGNHRSAPKKAKFVLNLFSSQLFCSSNDYDLKGFEQPPPNWKV